MKGKYYILPILVILLCMGGILIPNRTAKAAEANISLQTAKTNYNIGEELTLTCTVSSDEEFSGVQVNILYDSTMLRLVQGGNYISGGNGEVFIDAAAMKKPKKSRGFSMRFQTLAAGSAAFQIGSISQVTNEEGSVFGTNIQETNIEISAAGSTPGDAYAQPTALPAYSNNNKIKKFEVKCVSMKPKFDNKVYDYTIKVDCNTSLLYYNIVMDNNKAHMKISNNNELLEGENKLKMTVTAESGKERVFNFKVIRESVEETKIREQEESDIAGSDFEVYSKNGAIYIQNKYQYKIVQPGKKVSIPSGFQETSLNLNGQSITAYTPTDDLDSNYLLMYLKGSGQNKAEFYQYDRTERTLQKYTGGSVTEQRGEILGSQSLIQPGMWVYGLMVGLATLVVLLLLAILNMALRNKFGKDSKELNDMDF